MRVTRARARSAPRWDRIRRDRRRGAYPLSIEALHELRRTVRGAGFVSRRELRSWARALSTAQPAMGPILRLAAELKELGRGPGPLASGRVRSWVARRERELRSDERRVVGNASRRLRDCTHVVVFSHSSVVRRALLQRAHRRPALTVRVLRSLPGTEALDLARELRRAKVSVEVVPDREAQKALRGSDLVLVGADTVYRDGSLLHKVGTRRVAAYAAREGIPLVALAGRWKRVATGPPRSLRRLVGYDRTPASLVTAYWTERGPTLFRKVGPGTR